MTSIKEFFLKKADEAKGAVGTVAFGVVVATMIAPHVSQSELEKVIPFCFQSQEIVSDVDDDDVGDYLYRYIDKLKIEEKLKEVNGLNDKLAHSFRSLNELAGELLYLAEVSADLPVRDQISILSNVSTEWLSDLKQELLLMSDDIQLMQASYHGKSNLRSERDELDMAIELVEQDLEYAVVTGGMLSSKISNISKEIDIIIHVSNDPDASEEIATDAFVRLIRLVDDYRGGGFNPANKDPIKKLIDENTESGEDFDISAYEFKG